MKNIYYFLLFKVNASAFLKHKQQVFSIKLRIYLQSFITYCCHRLVEVKLKIRFYRSLKIKRKPYCSFFCSLSFRTVFLRIY
jgi:hypothetical protein